MWNTIIQFGCPNHARNEVNYQCTTRDTNKKHLGHINSRCCDKQINSDMGYDIGLIQRKYKKC